MIYFNINIRNPRWWDRFENLFNWAKKTPFENKWVEFEVLKIDDLFRIEFEFTTRQDHAGLNIELGLFGYRAMFSFYDTRHWNEEAGRYYTYDSAGNAT